MCKGSIFFPHTSHLRTNKTCPTPHREPPSSRHAQSNKFTRLANPHPTHYSTSAANSRHSPRESGLMTCTAKTRTLYRASLNSIFPLSPLSLGRYIVFPAIQSQRLIEPMSRERERASKRKNSSSTTTNNIINRQGQSRRNNIHALLSRSPSTAN